MLPVVMEGLVVLCLVSSIQAGKRFQDVMEFGRKSGSRGPGNHINGWSPDTNSWNETMYPAWKSGDTRWEHSWMGGKVVALLTSDSPALIGSNITFAVNLQFPRCQKENEDGDIVYERGCENVSSSFLAQLYTYWSKWIHFCNEGNCSFANSFPDGRPFPYDPRWRRHNFIYIFSTQGQYYGTIGRSSTTLSINTTNITAGMQMMEVKVFRRGSHNHYPVATASSIYVVTDQIPFYVNLTQKNDQNSSDSIFIKDSPIKFDIHIHDPSNYLKNSELTFDWDYGDGNGSSASNNPVSSHIYTMLGSFRANLTIKAAIPGLCKPVTPTPIPTQPLPTTSSTFTTSNSADGILEVNIVEMTSIQVATSQTEGSLVDFVVTCEGSLPTDACTVVSDASCMIPQDMVCEEVPSSDQCLLILRRAFEPGSYCVNITLSDGASLALASTLVSIDGGSKTQQTVSAVLVPLALVALVAVVIGITLYRKYKEYKPIANASDGRSDQGIIVYFSQIKDVHFKKSNESDHLLKSEAAII
ncbi:protein QNR-71-like isoform X2 [Bufo gargarizans]|uniref:protein QNR-71-like isoform X2 n=1 Tax=Bufo gargarizans TaxID=30331 RepID=UPI001CF0EBAB|nr:protein QNR-71-like isoform X2 [Bufo gargarizans]XP_044149959.1 protein QNR-71-like isoform X2 [Bufo gargarizans]